MKSSNIASRVVTVAALAALCGGPALAQGSLLDTGKSLLGSQGTSNPLSMDQITSMLEQQGYSKVTGLAPSSTGNALQATATNKSGSLVDLMVNPLTGKVLSATPK